MLTLYFRWKNCRWIFRNHDDIDSIVLSLTQDDNEMIIHLIKKILECILGIQMIWKLIGILSTRL